MKKKKISKEELEDILHEEEVEARWKEIEKSGVSRKAKQNEAYWKEHLEPFYAEIMPHIPAKSVSEVVNKEHEEYIKSELDGGLFAEFYVIENFAKSAFLLYMAFYLGIAVLFLSFMLI